MLVDRQAKAAVPVLEVSGCRRQCRYWWRGGEAATLVLVAQPEKVVKVALPRHAV